MRKTAVITGGAGGLGRALDARLRARGWSTVLVDLPGPPLAAVEPLADRMTIGCDLTDPDALAAACDRVRADCASVDLVIYNAGVTRIGPFGETPQEAHRAVFEINYFAAVAMARHLQDAVRQARGIHLAISSVAGFTPLFHRTAYAGSKHALEGFFKSLRAEEAAHGVACLIAAPSFVATNIGNPETRADGLSRPGAAADGIDYMAPDEAARIILAGVDRRRSFIPVGRVARLSYILNRLSPGLLERIMQRRFAK
jgi:NAD(P)-dependent dehydrogenase (short-subunit alcohol dehydrogenase family)